MNPVPGEELSKRYVMSTGNTDYDSLPSQKFSRNPLTSRSMMERRMSPSVIGELNNRISREQGPGAKSNGFYAGDNIDSFSKPGKQDVVYYGGGAVKDRPNMAY
ncbi:uncharacterized protein LOC108740617 [Agrilus planipennis]|uniref:Uncharacterized protein LOC108740617 n=1 Tax=Agrilus planipennis TaxID=224129 RepID=A0A7F5RHT4_AGRPL|nr:uncharacterized protein LOC108740617 [Agrilus planipennis]